MPDAALVAGLRFLDVGQEQVCAFLRVKPDRRRGLGARQLEVARIERRTCDGKRRFGVVLAQRLQLPGALQTVADRIARTTFVGEAEEALPLIIDDALVDVEPSELFKLLSLIVRLSTRTQIVLLTSDTTIAKWARREAAHGIVTLLETDGAAVR